MLSPLPEAKPDAGVLAWFKSEPEAYAAATSDPRPAADVMTDFVAFVRGLPGTPVFASHPLALDGVFFDYYLRRFTRRLLLAGHRDEDPLFPHPCALHRFVPVRPHRLGYVALPLHQLSLRMARQPAPQHRAIDDALGYAQPAEDAA